MKLQYRLAKIKDVDSLLRIENSLFKTDRLSKKSFVHFVRSDKSDLYVALIHNTIVGYYLLLYNRGTSLARLYSIAISKRHQGKGYGEALLMHAEKTASANRKNILRLEVRPDNPNAIRLYEKMGYRKYDVKKAFYEDKTPAFCFEKKILPSHLGFRFKIPYFQQNTPFTCGPASLIMAMSSHDKNVTPSLELELDIWREATTIFMTSGHGGCGPRGLALSAQKRGFLSEVWVSKKGPLFTNGVRTEDKKNIMRIVHHKFENEIMKSKTPFHVKRITLKDLDQAMKKKWHPHCAYQCL